MEKMKFASTRSAYGKALLKLGKENPNIVVMDADLACSTKTALFGKEFPDRFFNMGIAEANMMGFAAGLAISGKIVYVSTFAMFAVLRPYEQIRNSIASQNLNVKIVATHAGISVGEDGLSHQAIEDVAILRAIPNMKIFVPADAVSAEKMVEEASKILGPVYIRLSRPDTPTIYNPNDYVFHKGQANILKDATEARIAFIAAGNMVYEALKVSERFENEGISTIVADFSSIKPLDKEKLISIARRTKLIITMEEHTVIGGLGSAVCETLSEEYPAPVIRIGINDLFGESGSPAALFQQFGLNSEEVYRRLLKKIRYL